MNTLSFKWLLGKWLLGASMLVGLALAACSGSDPAPSSTGGSGPCLADTNNDPANCGSCGAACTVGQSCQGGACVVSCVAPQVECGGLCADPATNSLHCGGCNQPCGGGEICQNSTCVTGSCAAGQSMCNGACVDTLSDTANCGSCGAACLVGQTCEGGTCAGGASVTSSTSTTSGTTTSTTTSTSTTAGGTTTTTTTAGGTTGTTTGGGTTTDGSGGTDGSTTTDGGATTTGGMVGPGVEESESCPDISWPSGMGSTTVNSVITVGSGETYDGEMQVHEGSLEDCSTGNQDTVEPLIDVQNNGTVRNIIFGKNIGDGIHCEGSCTIENVWFPYVCDDAISALGSGTVNISNSGFKNARDKTIQHNGTGTVNLDNIYVETAGKLYRSCGEGCSGNSRTANLSNIVAIGVSQVAGVSENDTVTLSNICVHRTFSICTIYQPGSSDESTQGANGSEEGPNANCVFSGSDTHALLSRVTGVSFSTESACGGPNAYKSGDTATACVDGFDSCLKPCAPGGYGFKQISCADNGRYEEGDGLICAMPTDSTAAAMLDQARVMGATNMVNKNDNCSNEWDIGIDSSNNAKYCVCVHKPGYYDFDNWLAWDCQDRWW